MGVVGVLEDAGLDAVVGVSFGFELDKELGAQGDV